MRHIDLFSGIGGFALAASWVWPSHAIEVFCEIDPFCRRVLAKHWPDAPVVEDIHKLDGGTYAGADLLTGGFPCQPYSTAGRRRGARDHRALWPEMLRVIAEARPRWVIAENVVGFITMGLDDCCADLERAGYSAVSLVIPACAVNAPHRRGRLWIVAHADSQPGRAGLCTERPQAERRGRPCDGGSTDHAGPTQRRLGRAPDGVPAGVDGAAIREQWASGAWESGTPRVAARSRQPGRSDRLRALGNAIVPQVAYEIMSAIQLTEEQL